MRLVLPDVPNNVDLDTLSPWLDLRIYSLSSVLQNFDSQLHCRVIKIHLPADKLLFSPLARYIYVARDGRDIVWSFYHHHSNLNANFIDALNGNNRVGPEFPELKEDAVQYFKRWLENDGFPLWSFWDHIRSWWRIRNRPKVKLLHFARLK